MSPADVTEASGGAMDLRQYEQDKFAIADALRSVALLAPRRKSEWEQRIGELLARLADDRFNLVVVGRFSRGKTSLMNAILGTDRLPTGIVPLTSVITTVAYGSKEQVVLKHHGRILEQEVPIADLPLYITQQGNPANVRGLKMAQVQLPAEFLRRGFYFVDTPGLGSAIEENTRTTESFLPEADALLLVTSFESPLSEEEFRILKVVSSSGCRIFVVLNKQDTVSVDDRNSAVAYVRDQLRAISSPPPEVFSVSAKEGLEAKLSQSNADLLTSGIPALEDMLIRFLLTEKRTQFLMRMCDRVAELLEALPPSSDAGRLQEHLGGLRHKIAGSKGPPPVRKARYAQFATLHARKPCEVCGHSAAALWDFLCTYQHDLSVKPSEQQRLAEHGGLCSFHTWYYASLAAPRDVCRGYPVLLDRLAASLRGIAAGIAASGASPEPVAGRIDALSATEEHCVFCAVCVKAEQDAISSISRRLTDDAARAIDGLSTLCIPHLAMLAAAIDEPGSRTRLLEYEATMCERVAEDMRRYALKLDATRRFLVSGEEEIASGRGLRLVAGHRDVNATARSPRLERGRHAKA